MELCRRACDLADKTSFANKKQITQNSFKSRPKHDKTGIYELLAL